MIYNIKQIATNIILANYVVPIDTPTFLGVFTSPCGSVIKNAIIPNVECGDVYEFTITGNLEACENLLAGVIYFPSIGTWSVALYYQTSTTNTDPVNATLLESFQLQVNSGIETVLCGWNILTLTFIREVDLSAQVDSQQGIELSLDGSKMFIADGGTSGATDSIHEYNLTTPFNISTKEFVQSKNVSAQDGDITDVRFSNSGLKMFVLGRINDKIFGYDLSIAYDISTAVHNVLDILDVSVKDATPTGMVFKPNGTKLYFLGAGNDKIYEYDLSTAFDITSAVFLQDFALPTTVGLSGIYIRPNGTRVYYISSFPDDKVFELILSTAFDISTATVGDDFDISAKTAEPRGLYFKNDGTRMYFLDQTSDKAFEYSLTS